MAFPKRKAKRPVSAEERGRAAGYRSGLEDANVAHLEAHGEPVFYEQATIKYDVPARGAKYKPDLPLRNGIIVETKGRFVTADRQKHKHIKEQHPDLDIRFVFSNPNNTIGKKSTTTYGMWCERLGIPYAKKLIPLEWIKEAPCLKRLRALKKATGWEPPSTS